VTAGAPAAAVAFVSARSARITTILMNLASIVERADEGILPAVRRGFARRDAAGRRAAGTSPPEQPQCTLAGSRPLQQPLGQRGGAVCCRWGLQCRCRVECAGVPGAAACRLAGSGSDAAHAWRPPAPSTARCTCSLESP
jgi:hypothetical protein